VTAGWVVVIIIVALLSVLWLTSMVSVLTNPDRYRNGSQLVWVLVLLLAGPVGAILYQCLGPVRVEVHEPHLDRKARSRAMADPWSTEEDG